MKMNWQQGIADWNNTLYTLMKVLFWWFFYELRSNGENKHKNDFLGSA